MDERQEELAKEVLDGQVDAMEDQAVEYLWDELHNEIIDTHKSSPSWRSSTCQTGLRTFSTITSVSS